MTLTFDQKPVDLYVLSLYVGWDAPERRQFRRISHTLPILVLIGVTAWLIGQEQTDWLLLGTIAVLAVASVYLMPRLVRWMQTRRIDNMIRRHPRPELLVGPRQVTFDEAELRMQVEDQVSAYPWAGMSRWVELRDHYLIFVKANVALVIPKSAFADGQQEQQMVAWLTQKLGQQRRHMV
jgi:hypothetical protein